MTLTPATKLRKPKLLHFIEELRQPFQIAEAMQCCDRELDVLERKVALLKQQKKGLMQQLLTGKTRVKLSKGGV